MCRCLIPVVPVLHDAVCGTVLNANMILFLSVFFEVMYRISDYWYVVFSFSAAWAKLSAMWDGTCGLQRFGSRSASFSPTILWHITDGAPASRRLIEIKRLWLP